MLTLIVALRERVEQITAGKTVLDQSEPTEANCYSGRTLAFARRGLG
jgi:hypothetical protein